MASGGNLPKLSTKQMKSRFLLQINMELLAYEIRKQNLVNQKVPKFSI